MMACRSRKRAARTVSEIAYARARRDLAETRLGQRPSATGPDARRAEKEEKVSKRLQVGWW